MNSASDFYVFTKWLNAPSFAFGSKGHPQIVPEEDKGAYWRIHEELLSAAEAARQTLGHAEQLFLRPKRFYRDSGSRGHRPTDLWVSVCSKGSEVLGYMPQVYAIASHRGLEIGFAASISEDDYFDAAVKARNRSIIPFINSKLPGAEEALTQSVSSVLQGQGGWHFNQKTRLIYGDDGFDEFGTISDMFRHLKGIGDDTGGGAVCRVFPQNELEQVNLEQEFLNALGVFAPLLSRCAPSPWDTKVRLAQISVEDLSGEVQFSPTDASDGRTKVLAEIARRQGQGAFRRELIEAYGGACAISGTNVADVLQAAHIRPYNGPKTNHVTNGLLLRADLHTLFDLALIAIEPNSMKVVVSDRLRDTIYWAFNGATLRATTRASQRPNSTALAMHFNSAVGSQTTVT
jgi:hypothetical protein